MDALTRMKLVTGITNHDKRMSASEQRRGQRVNVYRLAILLQCIDGIAELVDEKGWDLRRAILKRSSGRVSAAMLKAIGQKVQSREEAAEFGH